jgi:L-threonylcarbamoyladenylate synthase
MLAALKWVQDRELIESRVLDGVAVIHKHRSARFKRIMTEILRVDAQHPSPEQMARAAHLIRSGGLVAFPTETVYGLGADGLNAGAVKRIFEAKGRPASDPLILHLGSSADLGRVTARLEPRLGVDVQRLAGLFWPGPLTLVLPRGEDVPFEVTAGGETVAVRVPAHPVAHALIEASGTPIAAPSANLFSRPSPTRAEDVLEDLRGRIDLLLDGGPTMIGLESSVLDLTADVPTLLRPGGVPLEALEAVLGEIMLPGEAERTINDDQIAPAPGMLLKHYSPRARLVCLMGNTDQVRLELRAQAERVLAQGERLGVLLCNESMIALDGLAAERVSLGSLGQLEVVAACLFTGMRALDRAGVDVILTHGYDPHGLGRALNDRLYRAAEGRIVRV